MFIFCSFAIKSDMTHLNSTPSYTTCHIMSIVFKKMFIKFTMLMEISRLTFISMVQDMSMRTNNLYGLFPTVQQNISSLIINAEKTRHIPNPQVGLIKTHHLTIVENISNQMEPLLSSQASHHNSAPTYKTRSYPSKYAPMYCSVLFLNNNYQT